MNGCIPDETPSNHQPSTSWQKRGNPPVRNFIGIPGRPKKESCGPDGDDFRILGENKKSGLPTKMISCLQFRDMLVSWAIPHFFRWICKPGCQACIPKKTTFNRFHWGDVIIYSEGTWLVGSTSYYVWFPNNDWIWLNNNLLFVVVFSFSWFW